MKIGDELPNGRRLSATAWFKLRMKHLRPGDGVCIKLQGDQPFNRSAYLRINAAAYALWGAGSYRIRAGSDEVLVVRKAAP